MTVVDSLSDKAISVATDDDAMTCSVVGWTMTVVDSLADEEISVATDDDVMTC